MKPIYTPFVSADPTRLPPPRPALTSAFCVTQRLQQIVYWVSRGRKIPGPRRSRPPPFCAVSFLGEGQIQMSPAPSFAARESVRIVLRFSPPRAPLPPCHTRMLQMIRKRPSTALCGPLSRICEDPRPPCLMHLSPLPPPQHYRLLPHDDDTYLHVSLRSK